MPDLETVDLAGVEIMAAGERVHGRGSPPEGDVYDTAALERLAENTNSVLDQARPFVKLGHNPGQKMLRAEGFYDADDEPQTGRLANLRVDGEKLVSDIKGVPKKLADLITARAFPSRSTELAEWTSTGSDEKLEIVSALAWLGAKPPAFKTLADVTALYADQAVPEGLRVAYAATATDLWPEEESLEWLRSAVDRALNPRPPGGAYVESRYWVRDVAVGRALVCEGYGESAPTWVVPFATSDDGLTLAASDEWVMAEQQWVDAAREMAEEHERRRAADTAVRMPDNDTTLRSFAEAAGLEGEAPSDQILDAVRKLVADRAALETKATEAEGKAKEFAEQLAEVKADAQEGKKAAEELRKMRRDRLFSDAVADFRLPPADVEKLRERYDKSPDAAELVTEHVESLPKRTDLTRAYGADATPTDAEQAAAESLALFPAPGKAA